MKVEIKEGVTVNLFNEDKQIQVTISTNKKGVTTIESEEPILWNVEIESEEKAPLTDNNNSNSDFRREVTPAISWWYSIPFEQRFLKTIEWLSSQNRNTTEIHANNLTPTEIHQIYTMFYN